MVIDDFLQPPKPRLSVVDLDETEVTLRIHIENPERKHYVFSVYIERFNYYRGGEQSFVEIENPVLRIEGLEPQTSYRVYAVTIDPRFDDMSEYTEFRFSTIARI